MPEVPTSIKPPLGEPTPKKKRLLLRPPHRYLAIAFLFLLVLALALVGKHIINHRQSALRPLSQSRHLLISIPANKSSVSGNSLTVSATALGTKVSAVQFKLDGLNLASPDTKAPYQVTWDTTRTINGTHSLGAVALNGVGKVILTQQLSVITNNPAPVSSHPRIEVIGPMEMIHNHSSQACIDRDYPDEPVRAFVTADNRVFLYGGVGSGVPDRSYSTQFPNRQKNTIPYYGSDLNHIDTDPSSRCPNPSNPPTIFFSNEDPVPGHYDDHQWLDGTYTGDGKHVYALVHHEFHGDDPAKYSFCYRAGQIIRLKCWYDSVNFAYSDNSGASFQQPAPTSDRPTPQLIASAPWPWEHFCNSTIQNQCELVGYKDPSNIIKKEGYYYAFIGGADLGDTDQGKPTNCLIRTQNLADPTSWRAWDGSGFNMSFINPYQSSNNPEEHRCKSVDYSNIQDMQESLSYNTYLHKYILVGYSTLRDPSTQRLVKGFYYSFSNDLIHWSQRARIDGLPPSDHEYESPDLNCPDDINPIYYPSLLDPTSPTRNFETSHDHPYLYFTLTHYPLGPGCPVSSGPNRDIVRFPILVKAN